jgi:Uma2 family endonuclease
MVTVSQVSVESRVTLRNISWLTYETLLAETGDRAVRLTFDHGELEMMTPSFPHESYKGLLGKLSEAVCLIRDIPLRSGGATTHRREDLQQGLEPDESYWIEHEVHMRGARELDLAVDPPPDLVVEVDITSSSLDRINIYWQLGVPEIWHWTTKGLRFLVQGEDGQYATVSQSRSFPFVDVTAVATALQAAEKIGETQAVRQFLDRLPYES